MLLSIHFFLNAWSDLVKAREVETVFPGADVQYASPVARAWSLPDFSFFPSRYNHVCLLPNTLGINLNHRNNEG